MATNVVISANGSTVVNRRESVRLTAHDTATPKDGSYDTLAEPGIGNTVKVGLGSTADADLIFHGSITDYEQKQIGDSDSLEYSARLTGPSFLANRRLVYRKYVSVPVYLAVLDVVAAFMPGFTSTNVDTSLTTLITTTFDGVEPIAALNTLARLSNNRCYIDDPFDVHFFSTETTGLPDALDSSNQTLKKGTLTRAKSVQQIRNRIIVTGSGGDVLSAPNATSAGGGSVNVGVHRYGITFVSSSGETFLGPLTLKYVSGVMDDPTVAPVFHAFLASVTPFVTPGAHDVGYAWIVTGVLETNVSPTISVTVGVNQVFNVIILGPPPEGATHIQMVMSRAGGGTLYFMGGQISVSGFNPSNTIVINQDDSLLVTPFASSPGVMKKVHLSSVPIGPPNTTQRKVYRDSVATPLTMLLDGTIANNSATTYDSSIADASLGAAAPTSDTSALGILKVQVDDLTAQSDQATREGGGSDGIHEYPVNDSTLTTYEQCVARAQAELDAYASPVETITYETYDTKTAVGKKISVNLLGIVGDYTIKQVDFDEVDVSDGKAPALKVTATSVRLQLQDIIRAVLLA